LARLSIRFENIGDLSSFLFDEEGRLGIEGRLGCVETGKISHEPAAMVGILSDKLFMSCSTNSDSDSSDTRELLIVYATETGNARDVADFIARQCRRIAFQCRVVNVESISLVGYSFLFQSFF